jgi:hypothetical protein
VNFRKWTTGVIVFGGVVALGLSLWTIEISLLQLGVAVWAILPMAVLWFANCHTARRGLALAVLIDSVCVVVFGCITYLDAFFVHLDAQSGLAVLFVPLYQLAGAIPCALVSGIAWLVQKHAQIH